MISPNPSKQSPIRRDAGDNISRPFFPRLAGTRAAGFVLTRQEPAGKWTAATYHTHRGRRANDYHRA